jgi:hypothetical protein
MRSGQIGDGPARLSAPVQDICASEHNPRDLHHKIFHYVTAFKCVNNAVKQCVESDWHRLLSPENFATKMLELPVKKKNSRNSSYAS